MSGRAILPDLLLERERESPDRVAARVADREITYAELGARARAFAGALAEAGVREGDVVPLALPTSPEYLFAIFGVHLLGAAIAPVPPLTVFQEERVRFHGRRLSAVASCCGSRVAVVTAEAAARFAASAEPPEIALVTVESLASEPERDAFEPVPPDPDRIAVVQFSSGSTSEPKGVLISFRHIAANADAADAVTRATPADSFLSFLPLFHDFGLVAGVFYPFCWDIPFRIYPTDEFARRPSFWLKALSRTRATISPAPSFVFHICVHRVRDRDLEGVDLSAWRLSYTGAEPVHAETLRAFNERFAPFGLGPHVVVPAYGMAESTLMTTLNEVGAPYPVDRVSRDRLVADHIARPAEAGEPAIEIVSCGAPIPGIELAILDEAGRAMSEREVGEIALRGESVADEYATGAGERRPLMAGDWFRTGDLGYVAGGKLYVSGRAKELIILAGRNYYPQDIERAVERLDGVRLNGAIAFGCYDDERGAERVVVVLERATSDTQILGTLPDRARRAVFDTLGIMVDEVVVAPKGWVPKTTSGKLQRGRARAMYLEGLSANEHE